MPLPLTRPKAGLVAAAASYRRGSADSGYALRRSQGWQRQALSYLDLVPELSYSSRFYSRMLKPLRIFPGYLDNESKIVPIADGLPVELLARLKGKDGTKKQILGNYGRLMFTTGEGNLLGLHIDTPDEYWMFIWNDEVEVEQESDGTVKRIIHRPMMGNIGERSYSPADARIYRMWTPHPRRSGEADSPMRSVLEIAEELIILTAAVRSTAVSRTVNGLLLMPSEMAPLPAEQTGDEDPQADPFIDEMLQHLESQIEDAGSAAASAPWVIWGAYELLDKIRRVDLHDPQTDYMEKDLRKEAIERMARGLDYPAEVLTGLSSANHWAAKQILDDMWRSHGVGIADQFVGDINDAYLRPALREAGYADWEQVICCYDESLVVVPADQSADADSAFDRGAISNAGYRRLKNIPESDAPSKDEHDEWLAIKLKDPAVAGLAPTEKVDDTTDSKPPPDASDGPPPPGAEGDSGRRTRVVAATEIGAAEMALARCRELAGIRIKNRERKVEGKGATPVEFVEILNAVREHPARDVAWTLGPEKVDQLQLNPVKLVKGGADTLKTMLVEWGYSASQSVAISEMVESYAARTLFMSGHPTLPSGFAAQFEKAKEASNVSD